MKKFAYALLITFLSSLAFTACTEENITPANTNVPAGGGAGSTGPL